MLWFGSIIAHFVAIQKPWQRKCRSSSVHREKAHENRKVKARKRKTPHHFWCGVFCPLAGISWNLIWSVIGLVHTTAFPSPCGDKLKWLRMQRLPVTRCFRPLAGISWNYPGLIKATIFDVFPSPCGDKLKLALDNVKMSRKEFPSPCGDKLKFDGCW